MEDLHNGTMDDIAIIGMVCRFPDANNTQEFWSNLLSGKESVRPLTEQELAEWGIAGYQDDPDYVNAASVIDHATCFDYRFFGYSRKEAELMDPQQRLFLQACWHAMEDAGYIPDEEQGHTGVFAAARMSSWINQLPGADITQLSTSEGFQTLMGNDKDYLATRVAYKLGFTGPAMTIQTACSSSLVAVYQACRSILDGDCSVALAGGAALSFPLGCGYQKNEGMIFSPDGQCRPFSADANGIVGGSGVGVVVLKRLSEALNDDDRIYAVIKGAAINNDGRQKVGYTAPGGHGQQQVIEKALSRAGVNPEQIGYLEAHGTGTVLGDPIEIRSISAAWQKYTQQTGYCAVGSVKGNVGHLDTTAGVASLIKTALALYHKQIPPSINCKTINPSVNFAQSPFFVAQTASDWPLEGTRFAAVSCFGIGGTNSHMVLEQAPDTDLSPESDDALQNNYQLLRISAPDHKSLIRQAEGWQQALNQYRTLPDREQFASFADWAFASQKYRKAFSCQQVIAARSLNEASDQIKQLIQNATVASEADNPQGPSQQNSGPIMMFSGQGGQWSGMGSTLFDVSEVYCTALTQCSEWMADTLQLDIKSLMFGQDSRLDDSRYAQPAIFAHQYALYCEYLDQGIKPVAVLGHSLGEYMAAVAAGIMTARAAAVLVVERAALMASVSENGAMLSVSTDTGTLEKHCPDWNSQLDLAAINSHDELVLSGPEAAVETLTQQLSDTGIRTHRLPISIACHSRWLTPLYDDFLNKIANVSLQAPNLPIWSTVTGDQMDTSKVCQGEYWADQILKPVCFSQALESIMDHYQQPLLEIGPARILSRYVPEHRHCCPSQLRHGNGEQDFWQSLAWLASQGIQFKALTDITDRPLARTLPLPFYAFALDECRPDSSYHNDSALTRQDQLKTQHSDVAAIVKQAIAGTDEQSLSDYPAMLQISDRFVAHYAWQALRQCHWLPDSGAVETHWQQQDIPAFRYPLLRRLLRPLESCGYLFRTSDGLQINPNCPDEETESLNQDFRIHFSQAMQADFDDLVDLLIRCGQQLAGMLTGDINPVDVVFRDNGAAVLNRFYSETVNARVVNQWLANAVQRLYQQHKAAGHRTMRVLEVGAGTGASTQAVLAALQGTDTEYVFTDVSVSFIDQAREKFGDIPGVNFALYDLDNPDQVLASPLQQPFDLVIAANSLHASQHMGRAMTGLTTRLSPQGHLLLRELTVPYAVFDLLFGPLAAIPEDSEMRGDDLILSGNQWQTLLSEHNFTDISLAPDASSELSVLGESVILASRSDQVETSHSAQSDHMNLMPAGTRVENLGVRLDVAQPTYQMNWPSDTGSAGYDNKNRDIESRDWWRFCQQAWLALQDVLGEGIYHLSQIKIHSDRLPSSHNPAVPAQLLVHAQAGGRGRIQLMLSDQGNWQLFYSLCYQRQAHLPVQRRKTESLSVQKEDEQNTVQLSDQISMQWSDQGRADWWPESLICATDLCLSALKEGESVSLQQTSDNDEQTTIISEEGLRGVLYPVTSQHQTGRQDQSVADTPPDNEISDEVELSQYEWQWQALSDMDLQLRREMVEPLWDTEKVTCLLGISGSRLLEKARQQIESRQGNARVQLLLPTESLSVQQWLLELNRQPVAGIIFVCDSAALQSSSPSLQATVALKAMGESLLNLIKALPKADWPLASMPVTLLTTTEPVSGTVDPVADTLTELLRCARNEASELKLSALNIEHPDQLSADLLQYADSPFQLNYHNERLHYPVLARKAAANGMPASVISSGTSVISSSGSYLVFGLGGIGRWLVQWLSDQGAEQLIIWTRNTPDTEQEKCLSALKDSGVQLQVNYSVDAASESSIEQAWAELPVKPSGIFVTVGEAASARLDTLSWSQCWQAMAGKIVAASTLVKLGRTCDFIQLFSSSSTLTAMPGLLPYVTANRFVESLAAQQWQQGYPVMSVAWGNWYQTGMDSGFDEQALNRMGFYSQHPSDVALLQSGLLAQGGGAQAICKIDWQQFLAQNSTLSANMMRFDQLTSAVRSDQGDGYRKRHQLEDQRATLRKMTEAQQKQHIQSLLSALLSDRLQLPEQQLTEDTDLFALGMDSLVFVDFSQALRQLFRLRFPVSESYQYRIFGDLLDQVFQRYADSEVNFENLLHADDKVIPVTEDRTKPFPMTDLQQAFWIGRNDSLSLGSVSCHQYSELELENFDLIRFEKAWNLLIQRHDMLRCIVLEDGRQQVQQNVPYYHIQQTDLRAQTETERQKQLDDLRETMTYQVMDPGCWPLFDIRASRISDKVTRLHIDLDVLMIDVHSFRVLYGELNRLMEHPDAELSPLQLTFRDCVQQEYLERSQPDYQKAQAFWQERAGQLPPAPQLPLRMNPDNLTSPRFRTLTEVVNRQVWQKLKQRATDQGATGTAVILAAFSEVLKRWSRDPHFSLNMTYYNRKAVHEQVMDIVGDFTSIMLLEADLRDSRSFSDRVNELQQELWQSLDHRQFSGVEVMREMARQASGSGRQVHMPVVFTSLIGMDFDNTENADWDLMGKQIHQVNQTPQVWLDYQLVEYGGNLLNRWFIVDQLFDPDTIEAMFAAFNQLLEYLARDDTDWGHSVTGLTALADLTDHAEQNFFSQPRPDQLMHDLFIQQATKTPLRPALQASEQQWSYQQLLQWVSRLSHHLVEQGVKRGDRVAVVMDKCPANVAAALAVQCTGAAYIPVAMEGADRCQAILQDSQPVLILTTQIWEDELKARCQTAGLDLPVCLADEAGLQHLPDRFDAVEMSADEPAYLIYTSGSTGTPKGVLLDHKAPLNTVLSMNEHFAIGEEDRFLSLTPPNHDMAVYDIYGPLATGGSVVIPDADKRKEASHWLQLMKDYQVSVLNVVPGFIDMLVSYLELSDDSQDQLSSGLRIAMMGGDWIPLTLPERLHQYWPDAEVHSIGGPTETAIVSVTYAIKALDPAWPSIPYGKPLANQKLHIMTPDLEPCPQGVAGEICVSGQCLALEYFNDAEHTARRFVVNPATGERLYRTGDAGCFLPDGNVRILGRMDQQVSVNGYRIEPGEIEASIKRIARVKDAVVVKSGEPATLHGYILADTGTQESSDLPDSSAGLFDTVRLSDDAKKDESDSTELSDTTAERINILTPVKAESPIDLEAIRRIGCFEVARLPEALSIEQYDAFFSELETYSLMVMWRFILPFERDGRVSLESITTQLAVKENYLHLVHSWFATLESEGICQKTESGEVWQILKAWDDTQWQQSQQWFEHYQTHCETSEQPIWQFFLYCTDHLEGLLTGDINPLEHMFRDGGTDLAESFYQRNRVPRHFNRVAGEAVAEMVAQWPVDKPIRVMEFGAGVGSITASVLPQLPADRTDYLFTDLSHFFFDKAKDKFSDYPFLRYELFDINTDPLEQGFEPGQFDLIIGANVLHDACNVDITSAYLKELLAPEGIMMVLEGTYNPRFQLVSFGFIEGLTLYQDERVETHLPLLPATRWCQLLEQAGFNQARSVPEAGMAEEVFNYHLMLAQAPDEQPVLNWSELTSKLRQALPDYMVPANLHLIRQLPITANGKTDRKTLAEKSQIQSKAEYKAHRPATETEQRLADIWQQVLQPGDEQTTNTTRRSAEDSQADSARSGGNGQQGLYGPDSNFFASGGDSLLMTRIAGLIKRQWHIELSLGNLLSAPVLSEQAELIDAACLLIAGTDHQDDLVTADFEEGEL